MEKQLMRSIFRVNKIRHTYIRAKMEKLGLSGNMNMILHKVGDNGFCSQNELSNDSLSDKASISRDCAKLEFMGCIEQTTDPANKRKKVIRLTKKGENALNALRRIDDEASCVLLSGLGEEERVRLAEYMLIVEKNAELLKNTGAD